jgi:hypothetical protein
VPSLYQLLLPADLRPMKFHVGGIEFDPVNIGFDTSSGSFEFDASVPGNSNKGHPYGTRLSEMERRQLLEYLKTL